MPMRQALSSLSVGIAMLLAVSMVSPQRVSQAVFADSAVVTSNSFTSGEWAVYYLHNNPTPPTANTRSQANLPMDASAPSATTLFNYDTDRDSSGGRLIGKGGGGATETDLTKYQNWRTPALAAPLVLDGAVQFEFWSAVKDFGTGKAGSVQVFLRDFNPGTSTYTTIGTATLTASNWQGGSSTWVMRTISVSVSNYTLQAGRQLEFKVVVGGSSGDDMWFAYDTDTYRSRLVLP